MGGGYLKDFEVIITPDKREIEYTSVGSLKQLCKKRETRRCYMTPEIGIDIGDIDAIVLAEVPWSVSSLLQRIGRGNRRKCGCHI
ncbi:MAG: helicase-related protein [Canidatus Methanoxibalbensis ujae]|nr:helicase-related protein [Candidatus Methanoxibalbensis ujae]